MKNRNQNLKHEIEFVKNFVLHQKKDRYLYFIQKQRNRDKFISTLDHPNFIEMNVKKNILPSKQNKVDLFMILMNKANKKDCYVMSSNDLIDEKTMHLKDALEKVVGQGYGTVLSILPGKLVYLETEDGDRMILEKP